MSAGSAEIHRAVVARWNADGLDWECKQHWPSADRSRHTSLNDTEATPGSPFPYVVMELAAPNVVTRMTGYELGIKRIIKDTLLRFHIYSKQGSTGSSTAKATGATLLERIMASFGGHPTERPKHLEYDHSNELLCQYDTDYGMAEEDDVYHFILQYRVLTDTPVAV